MIYLFRDRLDFSESPAAFTLDGQLQGTSYRGTYSRLELTPGRHQLGGYAGDSGHIEFSVEAGQLYFIRHTLTRVGGFELSFFQPVSAESGRQAVLRYELN